MQTRTEHRDTNYFSNCPTVNDIKQRYRRLAMQHHPDRGGDTRTMQDVNEQYQQALKGRHGETTAGSDGKAHTYYYREQVEREIMDIIAQLLKIRANLTIELVGTWVWVSGDTKPVRDQLKALDLCWHSKRQRWYWRKYSGKRTMTNLSMDDIRHMYGSRHFERDETALVV